jgi:exonuclease SbcC
MKYPLIYALSTVGILKHYNQDYLIHEQRTDFTGPNGVGKSIIADLFQLIFINDKHLFQFGTEGYKKEARQIHKLPHKCKDAYTFLTIEVEEDLFITIGVCIPNSSNRPLKPFIITADPDTAKPMKERTFGRDKLPIASHFINQQGNFSVVDELSRRFRDEFGLYFEYFSTNDQKDEHYARLYDQQLLPVDLSIPSSRRAFAKIIQSFSRARGTGDRSEELKDFLFDGVEKELEQTFETHKAEIEKQLRDYEELQKFIADLEAKQLRLEELNGLDETLQTAQKAHLLGNCGYSLHASNRAKLVYETKIADFQEAVDKAGRLTRQLPVLEALAQGYSTLVKRCEANIAILTTCKQTATDIQALEKRIDDLTLPDLPLIAETLSGAHWIDDYQDQELLKRIKFFSPIYRQYGSIARIEEQTELQKQQVNAHKNQLTDAISYHRLIIQLFSGQEEDSLIGKLLRSQEQISPAQEAVLFHLLKTHWGKPEGLNYPFYAEGYEFFDAARISDPDATTGACWLQLGDLYMQIPSLRHAPVFGDPTLRQQAVAGLAGQHKLLLSTAELELKAIQNFEKGLPYQSELSSVLAELDAQLYDYAIPAGLAITAQLILQLDGKTEELQRQKVVLEEQLKESLRLAGIPPGLDLDEIMLAEKNKRACWNPRAEYFTKREIKDSANEGSLRETAIPALEQQTKDKKVLADRAMLTYLEDRTELEKYYPELLTATLAETREEELRALKTAFETATINYRSSYRATCEQFPETAAGANPEIVSELKDDRYKFPLLELVLLGSKIRFRDQIGEELRTANRTRHKLVASIHETMLKIFSKTKEKYDEYRRQVWELNIFFKGKTISNKYIFEVDFKPSEDFPIAWINQLQTQSQQLYRPEELPIGQPVEVFVEDFFKTAVGYKKKVAFRDLLDPRTYFTLDAGLKDDQGKEVPGSTGETYSAKVLLGIGRLSKVQSANRPGIRFIILEETANLDKTNFNNFPAIAEEFGYQILTMTPKPFGADGDAGWYLYHLIPGKEIAMNDPMPASYYKTNTGKEELLAYLKKTKT